MENDQIEELAVNIIENEVLKYKSLKSNIPKGDKAISWDGYITVFDGKGRGKDNFEYNIDVQVKGRKVPKIKSGNNKFLLEKAHLINYQKQNSGTLLLVVDIVDNTTYQIYYANLLPVDLKKLLENNNSKAENPKISINLKPINDSSSSSLKNICLNFVLNSKRQMGIPIKDMEELKNIGTIELKVVLEKGSVFDYMLNNDVYTYAILNDELKTTVALPKGNFVMIQNEIYKPVKIKDKVHYSSYLFTKQRGNQVITIGKGIFFNLKTRKINFKFQGTLQERVTDMEFFIDLIENKTLTINGVTLKFPEYKDDEVKKNNIITEFNNKIDKYRILINKFKEFNVDFKADIDKLDEQDRNNLLLFKKLFCDNIVPKNLNIKQMGVNFIKIGNYSIAIFVKKDKNNILKIYNYFQDLKDIISVAIVRENEKPNIENRTSPYFTMNAKDILRFSNFDEKIIFESLDIIQNLEKQSSYINGFVLELLTAYDKDNKRKDILNLAKKINDRLIRVEKTTINELNKFQIIKRIRKLNENEKDELMNLRLKMAKDNYWNQNQCGIAILLENTNDYKYYYGKMNNEDQKLFNAFPIKNLYKN